MAYGTEEQAKVSPPYTSFMSLKTLISGLKEHGVPARIDRSVLTNFSGAVGSQIITALRFLRLINGDNHPGDRFHTLVSAYGTDTWRAELEGVIREAYEPLFALDLQTATPALFNEKFKKTYGGADAVLRKCMTFFLNAVREAEIPVSTRLFSGTKPRSGPTKRRSTKALHTKRVEKPKKLSAGNGGNDDNHPPDNKSNFDLLIEMLNPELMDDEEQKAVWTLIRYLKKRELLS